MNAQVNNMLSAEVETSRSLQNVDSIIELHFRTAHKYELVRTIQREFNLTLDAAIRKVNEFMN